MHVLFIEPFYGGSHAAFLDTLVAGLAADHGVESTVLTMPARHWKWRMRGAVSWLAEAHGADLRRGADGAPGYDVLFASSFLSLAELVGLFPHLGAVPRVLYFHENQLAYPVRGEPQERDRHYGFTQMLAAQAATRCVFNSGFNRDSFLDLGAAWFEQMPDARPRTWRRAIAARSTVLGLPMDLPVVDDGNFTGAVSERAAGPLLLWNHRWEHDKNPAALFAALRHLRAAGQPFRLALCGEQFRTSPPEFAAAREEFAEVIEQWGFVSDRCAYHSLLQRTDLAISTAVHEFFGLAMLEATWCGARPLVPDRLAYRELFPEEFRYDDLDSSLLNLCRRWQSGEMEFRGDRRCLVAPFERGRMVAAYYDLLMELVECGS